MKFSLVVLSLLGSLAVCQADAVRLQIKGPDGKPVAGAKVQVRELQITTTAAMTPRFLAPLNLTSNASGAIAFESKTPMEKAAEKERPSVMGSRAFANVTAPGLAAGMTWLIAGNNTLTLQKGQAYAGVALDGEQRPVKGARLRAMLLVRTGLDSLLQQVPLPQSTTDAQGHFRFDAVPKEGRISIEVNDPKWKYETFEVDLALKSPPLFLEPGGVVRGRLLKPDGTPAAGVRLANGGFRGPVVTRADGRFEVTGLGEENVYLEVAGSNQKLAFVAQPRMAARLRAGEVRNIGDWKTVRGLRAQGKVVDEDTQKPIAKASISLWGQSNGGGRTDAEGAFDIVMAGESAMFTAQAEGFVTLVKPSAAAPKNGVMNLGTIALKRGKTVSGVLLDAEGNAVPGYPLTANKKNGNTGDAWAMTGADGRFSFKGLGEGNYTVQLDSLVRMQGVKIANGTQFVVGSKATPLLRVVLASKPPVKPSIATIPQQSVRGRIGTADGTPIGGAKIALRLVGADGAYQSQAVLSQSDGSFSTNFFATPGSIGGQLSVAQVKRPGFGTSTNTVAQENGNWKVAIKMQPKGSALRGRIVDAQGQGVSHAFVALRDGIAPPVAADEEGNFALPDAPLANVTLLASNGPSFASFEVKEAGQKVEIVLPDAAPLGDNEALADTLMSDASFGWEWQKEWDALGTKRVEAIIKSKGIGDSDSDWGWGQYLEELAKREPKIFLAREDELREASSKSIEPLFEMLSMQSRASDGTAEQKATVRVWLDARQKERHDISQETVSLLLQQAEIAARLDAKLGASWLDYAAQIADQLPNNGNDAAWSWGKLIARTQKESPLSFIDGWKPTPALQLLCGAMSVYLETNDLENARLAYAQSEKLAQQATANPDGDVKVEAYGVRPETVRSQTGAMYARLLSRTNPGAALAVATSLREYDEAKALNVIAREAVKQGQPDIAKKAVEAEFTVELGNAEFVVEAASIAQDLEPAFAAQTWARAYDRSHFVGEEAERVGHLSFAAYAGARAKQWPGESRILIEREWQKRLEKAASENTESENRQASGPMSALVAAMAQVSPTRALEMLPAITERENLRAQTQTQIVVSLLSK